MNAGATPRIETSRLLVRAPEEADIPSVLRYYGENAARFAATDPPKPEGFLTEASWRKRLERFREDWAAERELRLFAFSRAEEGRVVAAISFTQMFRAAFQACYLGYSIDHAHEGQGLMTEALGAGIAYVFGELRFHRIMANHLPENQRSARVLKRLGFEVEGLARNYLFINGAWRDHVLTALTNPAWMPLPVR